MPNSIQSRRRRKGRRGNQRSKMGLGFAPGAPNPQIVTGPSSRGYPVMSPLFKNIGGFPERTRATLKYVDTFSLDPAAGSVDTFAYSLRNLYDPDTRIGGHQPSNYDRWTQIYNRWTVMATRVKMSQLWNSTSSVAPAAYGYLISKAGNNISGLNLAQVLEQPFVQYSDVPSGLANLAGQTPALKALVPSTHWLGVEEKELMVEAYTGVDGSGLTSSTADVYAEVFAFAISGNDPGAQIYKIELEFDCVFFEPKVTLPS